MKVCVGIPIVDHVAGECFPWIVRQVVEVARQGHVVMLETPLNMFPHDRPRHAILSSALDFDCDLLYFIDSDMQIPPGAFLALHAAMEQNNAAVVSGHYLRRGYPYTCVWSLEVDTPSGGKEWKQVDDREKSGGVFQIHTSGLGCALISVPWVRKNLKPPYFSTEHDGKTSVVTDDISFFTRVKDAGGLVLGHSGVRCGHACARIFANDDTCDGLRALDLKLMERDKKSAEELTKQLEKKG